jgi:hypothetical protein
MLKIEWKVPTITLNSFIDHYIRILPDSTDNAERDTTTMNTTMSPMTSGRDQGSMAFPMTAPTINTEMSPPQAHKSPRSKLLKAIKSEILE